MASRFDELSKDLDRLISQGILLYFAMVDAIGNLTEKSKQAFSKHKIKLPDFKAEYDTWYSESLRVIKQLVPERLDDFVKQYKNEKRKEIDYLTYGISDYLIDLEDSENVGILYSPEGKPD